MSTIRITGYTGSSSHVVFPTSIDGILVTNIGAQVLSSAQETVKTVAGNTIKTIEAGAFEENWNLKHASFPNCETIGSSAFGACGITDAVFPKCTFVNEWAFYWNYSILTVDLPLCSAMGNGAFYECNSVQTFIAPNCASMSDFHLAWTGVTKLELLKCEYLGSYACKYNNKLSYVYMPICSMLCNAFAGCSSLHTVILDECEILADGAFVDCPSLRCVSIPMCKELQYSYWGRGVFQSCSSLSILSLPMCSIIGAKTFSSCTALNTLYMLSNSVALLEQGTEFSSCPLSHIYVPQSLVSAYKSATNWSAYASVIHAFNG